LFEWKIHEILQLHRLAHEEIGYGTWHNGKGSIPITDKEEMLAALDLEDVQHPKLKSKNIFQEVSISIIREDGSKVESGDF
jgi:hypothetical protein